MPSRTGSLQLIFGPMFSGKSSELIRRIRRFKLCNQKCLLIRYTKDNRYSESEVSTHDGKTCAAVSTVFLKDVSDISMDYDVIGIDEGQFFSDILEFSKEQLYRRKIIIVAGLDATYQKKGFGDILNLVPYAESVDKLSAVCMSCGGKASFTKRIVEDKEIEVIGGIDKYMSVCRECYKLEMPPKRSPFKSISTPTDMTQVCNLKRNIFKV